MEQDRDYPRGFPQVAAFIAKDSDKTTTIYRRFDSLYAQNLLYLQARLQKLEAQKNAIDQQDLSNPTRNAAKGASSWEDLETLALTDERENERLELAEKLEITIKAYCRSYKFLFLTSVDQ